MPRTYEEYWITNVDDLRLYVRDYGCADPRLTVLCLHGLTRNTADFEPLVGQLDPAYRVLVVDQRGRGKSDYDPKPERYNVINYVADTWTILDHLDVAEVVVIGTSMGGLMAMLMTGMQPQRIRGAVLNDVGPVVEPDGIARIQAYVGKDPRVESWTDAVALVRANNEHAFPDYEDAQWYTFARRMFIEDGDGLRLAYDPAISQAISEDQTTAVPADLWPIFENMSNTPVLVVRGALSDILSVQTVVEMGRRHPDLVSVDVPQRGHAPMLDEPEALRAIKDFLAARE